MQTKTSPNSVSETTRRSFRVYPAGAIQGTNLLESLSNIERGLEWTAKIFKLGFAPFPVFSDHLFISKIKPCPMIVDVYDYSLSWLKVSDAVFLVPGWENSTGTKLEIAEATKRGIPHFEDLDKLCIWADAQIISNTVRDDYIEQILGRSDD